MSLTYVIARPRTWYRSSAVVMGTEAELLVDGDRSLVAHGFARLRRLEALWTRFDPESELNEVHRHPAEWVPVSVEMLAALSWCRRMHAETHGAFDPTIRRSLEEAGYATTFADVVDSDLPIPTSAPAHGVEGITIDALRHRVRISARTYIDLGGIGKGLAADMVVRELMGAGARSVYLSVGGDIGCAGEPPDDGWWPVPLEHPVTGEVVDTHGLVSGGLAMSTVALRRWRRGQETAHHIIDPRTGRPADTDLVAVAVAARSTARAEALAKAAIVLGSDDGARLLGEADVRGWLIGHHGVRVVEVPR